MIEITRTVTDKFPLLANSGKLLGMPARKLFDKINHTSQLTALAHNSSALGCFDFVDQLFDRFNFTYQVTADERQNIPDCGRVIILANQPYTPLHALAILRLVSEVRRDVKLVMEDGFASSPALKPVIINSTLGCTDKGSTYQEKIVQALAEDQAVIMFPSAKTSGGLTPKGKHQPWQPEFLHYCRSTDTPVLPLLMRPQKRLRSLSNAMRMKAKSGASPRYVVKFFIGELIASDVLIRHELNDKALTHRLRKHLFKLTRKQSSTFETVKTIAHPENCLELQSELTNTELLGSTRDNNAIHLVDFQCTTLMKEIGRLREITFRKVGEGTGAKRDLDGYDRYYQHLVLWNRERLEIAGAYRLGHTASIVNTLGVEGLYTHSLFQFTDAISPFLTQTVELGRSFVTPNYWGKNSLDYLWQGIGAYFKQNPDIRYVLGPVTISASFGRELTEEIVFYYENFFNHSQTLAVSRLPFAISDTRRTQLEQKYQNVDRDQGFKLMQQAFAAQDKKIPVLFKQYSALYEAGGFKLLAFNVDPNFADCIDGLFIADLHKLKASKRKRYLGS